MLLSHSDAKSIIQAVSFVHGMQTKLAAPQCLNILAYKDCKPHE